MVAYVWHVQIPRKKLSFLHNVQAFHLLESIQKYLPKVIAVDIYFEKDEVYTAVVMRDEI